MVDGRGLSRREFLRRAALGVAVSAGAGTLLGACDGVPAAPTRSESYGLAREDRPVTLPLKGSPIESGLPVEEGAVLRVFGWPLYVKPSLLRRFEQTHGVKVEWVSFASIEDAIARLRTGDESFDLFFPTVDVLGRLVAAGFLQPLNHDYLGNRRYLWDLMQDPFYDQGSRYTVPYFIWTTGIAWRNDRISEADVRGLADPYDVFWELGRRGHVHLLNGSRDALAMALIRNGVTDVNTGSPELIAAARDDLLDLNDLMDTRYDHLDYQDLWDGAQLHQSWSGNIGFARAYAPNPRAALDLSYWWPASGGSGLPGVVGNDALAIMADAKAPVAAHRLIDFLLDPEVALENVTYEGYQQPLTSLQPDVLVDQGVVLPPQRDVVVRESDFASGLQVLELSPEADALWQSAYDLVTMRPGSLP